MKWALVALLLVPLIASFCYLSRSEKNKELVEEGYISQCENWFIDYPDLECIPAFVKPTDMVHWKMYGESCSFAKERYKNIVMQRVQCPYYFENRMFIFFHNFNDCRNFLTYLRGLLNVHSN